MGYNTRRKSLSLPMLGIQLPNGSRAANRSPPVVTSPDSDQAQNQQTMPPAKKVKRSHTSSPTSPTPMSPPRIVTNKSYHERPKSSQRMPENTPPPSPGDAGLRKVDTQGIDDEIVVAVIEQLEKTGNKPHLLKELAAVLCTQLAIVESSANQSAIISSRLTSYLKRPWSALSPCPVGKELIGTHPKRIYFYLTTRSHQEFPDPDAVNAAQAAQRQHAARVISPSLSSKAGSSAGDDDEHNQSHAMSRQRASLSPELDLDWNMDDSQLTCDPLGGDNDIDVDAEPDVNSLSRTYSGRGSLSREATHQSHSENMSHNRRAISPPLEGDEREFTRTATELQELMVKKRAEEKEERERRSSRGSSTASGSASIHSNGPATPTSARGGQDADDVDVKMENSSNDEVAHEEEDGIPIIVDESEETCALRNQETAAVLFGANGVDMGMLSLTTAPHPPKVHFASSPLVKPTMHITIASTTKDDKDKSNTKWSEMMDLRSPETVELDELDNMFDGF